MKYFLVITFLFVLGSVLGWFIELLFRRFVSAKRWINPGFLTGPYLPLYGFGLISLYAISRIELTFISNSIIRKIVLILLMCVVVTFIEYLAGLIFIKGLKTKLWDYSNQKGNIQGIICPLFSFFWLIGCAAYNLLLDPLVINITNWFENNIAYSFFVGVLFGIMIIDFVVSINLANKIKEIAKEYDIIIKWEKLKENIAMHLESVKEHAHFIYPFKSKFTLKENIEHYKEALKENIKNIKTKIKDKHS